MAPSPRRDLALLALAACVTLLWEVLLTRACSLRLAFHYSFLVISNGLLGMGAAGSLLFALQGRVRGAEEHWLRRFLWLFALSVPLSYLWMVRYPIDPGVLLSTWDGRARFLVYNLGSAVPFFTGGLVIAHLLAVRARQVNRYYAADLVGAALGCVACPLLLWYAGAGGAGTAASAAAFLAATLAERGRACRAAGALTVLGLLVVAPRVEGWLPVPGATEVRLSRGESVRLGGEKLASRWSALSRVDVYEVPPEERSIFLRGRNVGPFPERQLFISQDGTAGTFFHDFGSTPEGLGNLRHTLYAAGTRLTGARSVLIVGAGGGADLWAVRGEGATRIKAFELNRQIVDLHRELFPEFSRPLLEDPAVELVHGEGRTGLRRERERWDLVQMSAIDTWSALTSGAYMLAENYLYTVDAVREMFAVLAPGGAVQITRLSGTPEVLRLLGVVHAAWGEVGQGSFAGCVVCLQAGSYLAVLCRTTPFTPSQLEELQRFLDVSGLDPVYVPGVRLGGAVEAFVRSADKQRFLAEAPLNLTPVDDDRPYFFNFTRWDDLDAARETVDSEAPVVQGNPLLVLGQLLQSALLCLLLLGLPLLFTRTARGAAPLGATLGYFGFVGLGFVGLEVTLMQQLVLLLGHPLYSVTVSLAVVLVATGVGSLLSARAFAGGRAPFWLVPAGLLLLTLVWNRFGGGWMREAALFSTPLRMLLAAAVLVPYGLLLGVPFAHGVRLLERVAPGMVPWAWAVNAAGTVLGAIATAVASMNLGFRNTLLVAVGCYGLAALCRLPLARRAGP